MGGPSAAQQLRLPSVSAAQAAGSRRPIVRCFRESHLPTMGDFCRRTRSGAAARPRFESPVKRAAGKSSGLAALRPFVSSEVAPAASGRALGCTLSIGWGACLIHHLSAVDCRT